MKKVENLISGNSENSPKKIELFSSLQVPLDEEGMFFEKQQFPSWAIIERIVYLGYSYSEDPYGDLFAVYYTTKPEEVVIWRGKLNDGVY